MQRERFAGLNKGMVTNVDMRVAEVRQFCEVDQCFLCRKYIEVGAGNPALTGQSWFYGNNGFWELPLRNFFGFVQDMSLARLRVGVFVACFSFDTVAIGNGPLH